MATEPKSRADRADRPMRLPRSTGAVAGILIVVLGVWGALIPFVGPYFHYAFGSYDAWHYSANRLWLDILPGAVAVVGGLLLLSSMQRSAGVLGGWLAGIAGAWFAIGPSVSLAWQGTGNPIGAPTGGNVRRAVELIGYFHGLGVVIVALAAFAAGRFVSRPRVAEEPFVAAGAVAGEAAQHRERRERGERRGLLRRRRRPET